MSDGPYYFVEPLDEKTNQQIADYLQFEGEREQTRVRCKGVKYPRQMWEASLEQCKRIAQDKNGKVRIWKQKAAHLPATRATWLEKPKKRQATRRKKPRIPKSKPQF